MKKTIGIPRRLDCLPLKRWVAGTGLFEIHEGSIADVAMRFRKRELDVAVVSPIEYARESSEYRVLPGFAISSRCGITLFFREGLRGIGSMAADPADVSEIVLTRIVLAEEFESTPPIIPAPPTPLRDLLSKADSALLTGDAGIREDPGRGHSIDIAGLWSDMVDLPYVHGIVCAREGSLTPVELGIFGTTDRLHLPPGVSSSDLPAAFREPVQLERANEYLAHCSFELNQEAEDGLAEFLRYAHYHGMIPDIPLLQMYPTDTEGSW